MQKRRSLSKAITLIPLFIFLLSMALPIANAKIVGLGVHDRFDTKTLNNDRSQSTSVTIYYRYGDTSDFSQKQITTTVSWDGWGVVVAALRYHKIGIQDDKGRIVASFLDAAMGGTAKKGSIHEIISHYCPTSKEGTIKALGEKITSTGNCVTKIIVNVQDKGKFFRKYKVRDYEITLEFYVKASTKAEAEAKVKADLLFVGASLSITSVVEVGTMYKVTVKTSFKYGIAYMDYDAEIISTMINSQGSHVSKKEVDANANIGGYVLNKGW